MMIPLQQFRARLLDNVNLKWRILIFTLTMLLDYTFTLIVLFYFGIAMYVAIHIFMCTNYIGKTPLFIVLYQNLVLQIPKKSEFPKVDIFISFNTNSIDFIINSRLMQSSSCIFNILTILLPYGSIYKTLSVT